MADGELQARPATPSVPSVSAVTKRSPSTSPSVAPRRRRFSSVGSRSRNTSSASATSPRRATSASVFPSTSISVSSTTRRSVFTAWTSTAACKFVRTGRRKNPVVCTNVDQDPPRRACRQAKTLQVPHRRFPPYQPAGDRQVVQEPLRGYREVNAASTRPRFACHGDVWTWNMDTGAKRARLVVL
jgi:hypothetical protein